MEILGKESIRGTDEKKELKTYTCDWPKCGYKFQQYVRTAIFKSKHKNCSTQVRCPKCGNGLKTW